MLKIDTLTSIKTRKHTNDQSNNKGVSTYNTIETPLNVGVGLYVFRSTTGKKLNKFPSHLNVRITYDKVFQDLI